MKKPLKVGDRVRVYVADCMLERDKPEMQMRNMEVTWTGVIKTLNSEGRAAYVIDDNGARMCWVHVRQCIRLIPPKARRREGIENRKDCFHPGCCCVCGHQRKCPEDGPCAVDFGPGD